jgi:hypothetical protein
MYRTSVTIAAVVCPPWLYITQAVGFHIQTENISVVSQERFLQKVRQHEKKLRGPLPRAQACVHITCSVFNVLEHFGVGTLLEFLPPYRMSTYEAAIILIDTERGREIFNVGRRFALALADRLLPKLGAKAKRDRRDARISESHSETPSLNSST